MSIPLSLSASSQPRDKCQGGSAGPRHALGLTVVNQRLISTCEIFSRGQPGFITMNFKPTRARHRQMQDVGPFAMKLRIRKAYKDV
jgi:hypothetical protein